MKLYIAVHEDFPDFMTPTLVAHATLGSYFVFKDHQIYQDWLKNSFKKVVLQVNQKEFDKLLKLPNIYTAHENSQDPKPAAIVVLPGTESNTLKYAKLWKPFQKFPTMGRLNEPLLSS